MMVLTVAIALRPATPAPMTSTLQGGIYVCEHFSISSVFNTLTLLEKKLA